MAFSYRLLIVPTVLAVCGAGPAQAFDVSTQGLVASAYATSKVTSAPFDQTDTVPPRMTLPRLLPLTANGEAHSWKVPGLSARTTNQNLSASDLELAQAILVQ
jgi:hypothetical protein